MLFRRRNNEEWRMRLRTLLWPRGGWSRPLLYVWHRLRRLNVSSHALALGMACGVFVSFTPFLGLHVVLAALAAWMLGGNILASFCGTFAGNPLTFPLIWGGAYKLGLLFQGKGMAHGLVEPVSPSLIWSLSWGQLQDYLVPLLKVMAIGGALMGVVAGVVSYALCRGLVAMYRARLQRHHTPTSASGGS